MHNRGALAFVTAMCLALVAATPVAVQERAANAQQATPGTLAAPAPSTEALTLRAQLHILRVENAQLRALLADAQAKVASAELGAARVALERELRDAFGCAADAVIDWTQYTTAAVPAAPCAPPDTKKD